MSATTTPKKRGRPSTGNAKSSTERSRLMRERAEQIFDIAFHPGRPLEPFADSALLLAFDQSYRQGRQAYLEAIGRELFTRAGISVEATEKDNVEATENTASSRFLLDTIKAENEGLRAEIAALHGELAEAKARNTVAATETNNVHATEKESVEAPDTPRRDADLVSLLLERHRTYAGIARALAGAGHKLDRSNLSRIHRDGQTASPETRAALLALVVKVKRET